MASKPKAEKKAEEIDVAATPKAEKAAKAPKVKAEKPPKPEKAPKEPPKPEKAPKEPKPEGHTSGVVDRSKYDYTTHKDVKTASGRASVDNDDPLAAALRGKTSAEVIELVATNGGEVNPNWMNLNQGLARMSAGNVLRKLAKRTEGIKIDGKTLAIAA